MSTCYLSGPMRGIKNLNFPAFDAAAKHLRTLGHTVINPADLDRQAGVRPVNRKFGPADCRTFAKRDLDLVLSLKAENGDFIAVLPGWQNSRGARAEVFVGEWIGLRVVSADSCTTCVQPGEIKGDLKGESL